MRRALALGLIVLAFAACDPVRRVSATRRVRAPLDRTCVVETLRMEEAVREAGVGATGLIYTALNVPEPLKSPEPDPQVGFDERRNDKGEIEIEFSVIWVGSAGSPEYRSYVQKVLDELRDRVIERCVGK